MHSYRVLHLRMNSLNLVEQSAAKKMASWTVYSVARSRWRVQCGIQVTYTKNFVAKLIQKKPWARLPVDTPDLVMAAGKGGSFIETKSQKQHPSSLLFTPKCNTL